MGVNRSLRTLAAVVVMVAGACTRSPEPTPPTEVQASAAPVPTASASTALSETPQSVETDPAPYLADGCPPAPHDVGQWKRIDPSTVTHSQMLSLNRSPCSWAVLVRDGIVALEAHRDERPSVPPGLSLPNRWGAPRVVRRGRSGMLFGFNHGEWGGALLWYADDGTLKRKLLEDNIVDVLPAPRGFIVLVGLNHLDIDTGRAIELIDSGTSYSLGRTSDLGSAPNAAIIDSSGAILLATTAGIARLERDFHVRHLLQSRWGSLYPVSLALVGRTAYVGMRGIVAEVELGTNTATETWLAPVALN